jgi:uncharacterized damage-inducible protein DinB
MAIPQSVASAAAAFAFNANLMERGFKNITEQQWLELPSGANNNLLWIVGHIVWARSSAVRFLGSTWTRPWLGQFARAAKSEEGHTPPTVSEMIEAWVDSQKSLAAAFENASEEKLAEPLPPPPAQLPPSFDGKMSGVVIFLAHHEWYHLGQIAYVRRCLGCM